MPQVILSKNAEKELVRLTKKDQRKIIRKLELLKEDPLLGKKLSGKLRGLWSFHAWPYRIIYELPRAKQLIVHKILHRQKAYK